MVRLDPKYQIEDVQEQGVDLLRRYFTVYIRERFFRRVTSIPSAPSNCMPMIGRIFDPSPSGLSTSPDICARGLNDVYEFAKH